MIAMSRITPKQVHEGQLSARGRRFGIVVSRFNDLVTAKLLEGALDCLSRHGAEGTDVEVAWVPGSFELPIAAQKLTATGRFDVVICLGAIVRSDTPHFDFVAAEAAKGIAHVGLASGVPVTFGVITADTVEQAIQRAGVRAGNRGWDAALNAIEMADLIPRLG
jgi:6,7-dimethyl-8-ribityllumazine synthase